MSVIYFTSQQTMLFTIPLMIVALGGVFSEQSDVVNIVPEGTMIMGVSMGALSLNLTEGRMSGQSQLLLAILISTATRAAFAFLHAYASINMKTGQTINGTALNMPAPVFAIFIARMIQGVQQTQFNDTFQIESVPPLGKIPFFGPLLFQSAYITTYLEVLVLIVSVLMLCKTRSGLRLCSCGEHPQTADAAGINMYGMQYAGMLISGVLGGPGGLVLVVLTSMNFNADMAGYGFLAPVVLIFGQRKLVKIMWASLSFGLMKAVAATRSGIPFLATIGIPSYVYKMIPYLAALVALVFTPKSSQAPKASGIPYGKGQR